MVDIIALVVLAMFVIVVVWCWFDLYHTAKVEKEKREFDRLQSLEDRYQFYKRPEEKK